MIDTEKKTVTLDYEEAHLFLGMAYYKALEKWAAADDNAKTLKKNRLADYRVVKAWSHVEILSDVLREIEQ